MKILMANNYTQLYIHCLFVVKYRLALIDAVWEEILKSYITAILQNNGHTMIAINNMPDHMHMLFGLNPAQSIAQIMKSVKGNSSEWINKEKLTARKFNWQNGYGAFSYSKSQIHRVANYIDKQKEHHQKKSFLEEYKSMLDKLSIPYEDKYLFVELED